MKTNNILKPIFFLMFMISFLMVSSQVSEAQRGYHRGQSMMGGQYNQVPDQGRGYYGPGMMGPGSGMRGFGPGMMGPGMGTMPGMAMTDFLNLPGLTDEQREEIRNTERQSRREYRETMLDMMDARDDLVDALAEPKPDPDRVSELHQAMSQKQREMLRSSIETRNQIYDTLTQEQRSQLREIQRRPFSHPYMYGWED